MAYNKSIHEVRHNISSKGAYTNMEDNYNYKIGNYENGFYEENNEYGKLLQELLQSYNDLLEEAICLYQHYPNNFRKTAEEYFKEEIELLKKFDKYEG